MKVIIAIEVGTATTIQSTLYYYNIVHNTNCNNFCIAEYVFDSCVIINLK